MLAILIGSVLVAGNSPGASRAIEEHEVSFLDGRARLTGTLYVPGGARERPALVLLGGAERGPRTDLKRIHARHFATCGYAALIYDSPGTGASTGSALMQTKAERVREALAAWRFLADHPGIAAARVGLWGFSEGAGIALLAAAGEKRVAFVIAVSGGLGIPPLELVRYRIERMGFERGLALEEIQRAIALEEILFSLLSGRDLVEWPLIREKVQRWPQEPWEELLELVAECRREELPKAQMGALMERLRRALNSWKARPWFEIVVVDPRRYELLLALPPANFFAFLRGNPLAQGDWHHHMRELRAFPGISCPVLAIWGELDRFVPVHRSAAVFAACMNAGGDRDLRLETIPGASHLITVFAEKRTFAEGYPRLMTDWLSIRIPRGG